MAWKVVITNQLGALTESERKGNASMITEVLRGLNWSDAAIAGVLGNIEIEGQMNPGQVEAGYPQPSGSGLSYEHGLGLIQWTRTAGDTQHPLARYAIANNVSWWDPDMQTGYLDHASDSLNYGSWGWIPVYPFNEMTFSLYKSISDEPERAAWAWLKCVERPSASEEIKTRPLREAAARKWYEYIRQEPEPLTLPQMVAVIVASRKKKLPIRIRRR